MVNELLFSRTRHYTDIFNIIVECHIEESNCNLTVAQDILDENVSVRLTCAGVIRVKTTPFVYLTKQSLRVNVLLDLKVRCPDGDMKRIIIILCAV